jgi:hypothetical protein
MTVRPTLPSRSVAPITATEAGENKHAIEERLLIRDAEAAGLFIDSSGKSFGSAAADWQSYRVIPERKENCDSRWRQHIQRGAAAPAIDRIEGRKP